MPTVLILWCIAVLLATGAVAVPLGRAEAARHIVYGLTFVACSVAAVVGIVALVQGQSPTESVLLPLGLPWIGAKFRLDPIAAVFVVIVNLAGASASFYGIGYGRHEHAARRVLPFFPAFIAGMNIVLMADDAFSFLVGWEFMSLSSWALVMAHHREAENARAGLIYLVMASFGTLALLLAFGLLSGHNGTYDFAGMRTITHTPALAGLAFSLALVGAGSKAGLVPLHVWLPLAHPAAPSHVSALMSGAMTKVAVYAVIRIAFDLLGPSYWWWAIVLLALGGISAVVGVLFALMQQDLKRLLAYSTIENVGIIFIGLGLAAAFRANDMMWAAALALTAALFHAFNHSVFKSLLFLASGAVLSATGERDLERLGGLIHKMPSTAFAFLAGAVAISALPPLNGFASEWLTFQAVLFGSDLPQWGLKILVPTVGALMALSAALAAACFIKAFGFTFLGRARSTVVDAAHEVDRFSLVAMLALAAICLMAGILPGYVIDTAGPAVQALLGHRMPVQADVPWLSIVPVAQARSSYNGLLVFIFIVISASLVALSIHRLASRRLRRAPAWDFGYPDPGPITQNSAGGFVQPIRRVFGTSLFLAREKVQMPSPGDTRAARFQVEMHDLIWEVLYAPLIAAITYVAGRLNGLQFLTIRRYLSLVFAALISLLLVLVIWL